MNTFSLGTLFSFGPALIFCAAVLWGLDGVLRRSLYTLPPAVIVFYEHVLGACLLAPFVWQKWRTLTRNEWLAVVCVALLSGLLGTLLFTSALAATQFISFSVVYLVQKLQPIFVLGMSALILRERPPLRYYGWAAVALIAGYFVTFAGGVVNFAGSVGGAGEGLSLHNGHVWAALLAFGAAVAWGSSTAVSRYALLHHDTTFITGLRFLLTVPFALLAVVVLGNSPALFSVGLSQVSTLLAIAFTTGMFALWIYYKGLQKTPATVSAIVELAFPLTAVGVDYFLYNTALAPSQIIAGGFLLFAAYKVASQAR